MTLPASPPKSGSTRSLDKPGEALKLLGAAAADEGQVQPSLPVTRKPVVKSPPAIVPAALREFLVKKSDGEETDSPMQDAGGTKVPMGKIGNLPGIPEKKKAILKARSREPSKSRAQSRGRTQEPDGGLQRSRSRGEERKRPVPSGFFTRVSAHRGCKRAHASGGHHAF